MPVLNGLETIPILRADHPKIKILVVTKYSDPKFVKECLQIHGVSGYVLKTQYFSRIIGGHKPGSERAYLY
jgi:DNA-binding NarL/FixJ family response regulator